MELHRLDCLSSNGRLESYEFVKAKLSEMSPEQLRPRPLLTGHDLIAAGYKPGPQFGPMLAAVEEAQLDSAIHSVEEALALVKEKFGGPND